MIINKYHPTKQILIKKFNQYKDAINWEIGNDKGILESFPFFLIDASQTNTICSKNATYLI